jgi:hypothetical protein
MLKSQGEKETWSPDDETMRAMYEAEKNDRIKRVIHDSMRSIYINGALIIICLILFITHWWWMRRAGKNTATVHN